MFTWPPSKRLTRARSEGHDFIDRILESYTQLPGPNLVGRMRFLYNRVPLIYVSTGLELDYREMVEAGLDMLEARMNMS